MNDSPHVSAMNRSSPSTTRPSAARRRRRAESSAVLAGRQQCLNCVHCRTGRDRCDRGLRWAWRAILQPVRGYTRLTTTAAHSHETIETVRRRLLTSGLSLHLRPPLPTVRTHSGARLERMTATGGWVVTYVPTTSIENESGIIVRARPRPPAGGGVAWVPRDA
jgi:hypothetical protein